MSIGRDPSGGMGQCSVIYIGPFLWACYPKVSYGQPVCRVAASCPARAQARPPSALLTLYP